MKQGAREKPSCEHEGVYHAAFRCQDALLTLTMDRLHDQKKARSVEGKKTGGFASQACTDIRNAGNMQLLCSEKSSSVIGIAGEPHGIRDPDPRVGEITDRHRGAFAFGSSALIILQRPRFTVARMLDKQVERIAQVLQTGGTLVRFQVAATLVEHRSGVGQSFQNPSVDVASSITPPFFRTAGNESFPCSGEALKDLAVGVGQKKRFDLLVVLGDLFEQGQQLDDQHQQQTRLRAGHDSIGRELRLPECFNDLGSHFRRIRMPHLLEFRSDLVLRSRLCRLWFGKGLQKQQGRARIPLGEQLQDHDVIGFETGRHLVQQTRLHMDQGILVKHKGFESLDRQRVQCESPQVSQITVSQFGQQICVDVVVFRSRHHRATIDGFRIDGVGSESCFEQSDKEQFSIGPNNTGELLTLGRSSNVFQDTRQLIQSGVAMHHSLGSDLKAYVVYIHHILMIIGPVQTCVPHYSGAPLLWDSWAY